MTASIDFIDVAFTVESSAGENVIRCILTTRNLCYYVLIVNVL